MSSTRRLAPALFLCVILAAGCGPAPSDTGGKSYPLEGTVVAVDAAERKVTIAHEEIPGFMPAMTMDFVVLQQDAALLESVSPGDEVTARLVVPDSRYWLEDLVVVTPRGRSRRLARCTAIRSSYATCDCTRPTGTSRRGRMS